MPDYEFDCEFVGLTFDPDVTSIRNPDSHSYSFDMHGHPRVLDGALSEARVICKYFAIPDDRISEWQRTGQFKDVLSRTVTQVGKVKSGELSVSIRSSLEENKPWRVTCELSFDQAPK
jgi:hypothetical protein